MDWKIVFSDIDGTVLNSKHELLISTIEVVQKLARNMAWIMKVIEASKGKIDPPETKPRTMTNFIR